MVQSVCEFGEVCVAVLIYHCNKAALKHKLLFKSDQSSFHYESGEVEGPRWKLSFTCQFAVFCLQSLNRFFRHVDSALQTLAFLNQPQHTSSFPLDSFALFCSLLRLTSLPSIQLELRCVSKVVSLKWSGNVEQVNPTNQLYIALSHQIRVLRCFRHIQNNLTFVVCQISAYVGLNISLYKHYHYNGMELQGVPQQIQLFVIGMIQAQNCIETHSHSILQGAVCSTLIFSYCMNPVILELKQRFACVNFADDTIVELKPFGMEKMVLEFLDKLFGKYGMHVNTRKCKSTANGAIVTFMGTKYSQNRHDTRTHISSDILIVATKYQQIINQMLERGLPRSNVMGLFLKCVCTKCSWAVRIDDYNDYTINDYKKVDEILARTFHNIAQPKAISQEDLDGPRSKEMIQSILALMAASIKNHNGFGLILPGLSFQTAQKLLASNKIDPRFKKLQHSIKSENEKMEHAALSTNQDCFVTHTLAYDFDYDNIEFRRAIDILFDTVSVNIPSRECSICHTVHEDSNHSIYCQNFSGMSIQRHNRTQYDLIAALPVKHQPKLSPTYGQFKSSILNQVKTKRQMTLKRTKILGKSYIRWEMPM
ncbi:RT/endonuclease [Hexamita inflata]|uniref:RT/endonuclease n=1 Tax=Hexamita inflata TaxID=28002 RepID=A0ABP1I8U6_9EUKA